VAPGGRYRGTECTSQRIDKTDAVSVCVVSADVAFAVLLAASVFTHALRGTLCTPVPPPGAHGSFSKCQNYIADVSISTNFSME
jgi:hypothetical protein